MLFRSLFAAPTNNIEFALRDHLGYQWALGGFEIVTIGVLMLTLVFGEERHGKKFHSAEQS